MAGPSLREESPEGRDSADTSGSFAVLAIVILLAVGLALRLIIAQVLLPGSGFPTDLGAFQAWANDIAQNGPLGFYGRQSFIDYPPVYLLLLSAVSFLMHGDIGDGVKLLPILADLGLAVAVWRVALDMGISMRRALVAAAIVIFNPVTWFNSAIWGQSDAVGSIFLLLGLRELYLDRRESAAALSVLALLTKMQLGILGFIVGFVILRRSLMPKAGEPDPGRILSSLGAGLAMAAIVCLPFTGVDLAGLGGRLASAPGFATAVVGVAAGAGVFALARRYLPVADRARRSIASLAIGAVTGVAFAGMIFDSIVTHLVSTFGEYPYLTLNAYNPWALMADGANAMDTTKAWLHDVPWSDVASGTSGSGYVIGPFSTASFLLAFAVAALLVALALAGRSFERDHPLPSDVTILSAARPDSPLPGGTVVGRTLRVVAAEIAGMSGAFLVGAVVVVAVMAGSETGLLYASVLGDGLLLATILGVSAWAAWRDDRQSLLVALTILSIAFFVEPTRAHERYLFPFFALGAVLLAASWRWTVLYVALAIANLANLVAVLVQYSGIPVDDGSLAKALNDLGTGVLTATWSDNLIWPIAVCGLTMGAGMIWVLLQMRPRAVAALAREMTAAEEEFHAPGWWSAFSVDNEFDDRDAERAPGPAFPVGLPASAADAADAGTQAVLTETDYVPDYDDDEWLDEDGAADPDQPVLVPAFVMRLWHRIARRSTHPDRSPALNSEPRGRLDRLDVWVLVALVVGILTMRVYRLDEPLQMHFDEVYHARTATEFLQEWRYADPHDIYEWTHPHLAKYAIAGGITLFSDDKVTSSSDLNVTVKDALVQPRTSDSPLEGGSAGTATDLDSRYGDRVFVATGSEVRTYDLDTSALVKTYAIGGAEALGLDASGQFAYVGTSSGHIFKIDTTSLDAMQNGKATSASDAVDLGVDAGFAIAHVYAGTAPYILAADSNGRIVTIDLSDNGGTVIARSSIAGVADFADMGSGSTVLIKNPTSATSPTTSGSTSPTSSSTSEADALASALVMDAASVQDALDSVASATTPQDLDLGPLTSEQASAVQSLIDDGTLSDISVDTNNPQVLIAYKDGAGLLDVRTLTVSSTIATPDPATSIGINYSDLTGTGIRSDQSSYVAAGSSLYRIDINTKTTPWIVSLSAASQIPNPLTMPGEVTKVVVDRATRIAHALGRTPDGKGWTIYAIETNGDAVFSDAQLPFEPVAMGLDSSPNLSDTNHEQILALSSTGAAAVVDVGQFAFSWRIIGVLFGALLAACLYLLVRLLFRRRSIGLLVALFSMTDGMLFVQSRIAMNDTYVGGFLLLAYLIFAIIWFQVGKGRGLDRILFWLLMPVLGLTLGLALASKWVGLYAIASVAMLILVRSALGRVLTILALAGGTGVLGWQAIAEMTTEPNTGNPTAVVVLIGLGLLVFVAGLFRAASMRANPDKAFVAILTVVASAVLFGAALTMSPGSIQNGAPNYTYFLIMLVATAVAAAANAYHPIAWTREELRFAIAAPVALGIVAGVAGVIVHSTLLLETGAAGVGIGLAAAACFVVAGRVGFGPLAPALGPGDPAAYAGPPAPAPTGWLRLGSGFGLPAAWMAACVLVLPIVVYVAFYIPWAMPWQSQTDLAVQQYSGNLPVLICPDADVNGNCVNGDGWPNGHTGQTLIQLTINMYNYHNDLRASHPASSPWWAWPMDLKPVWFENASYAGDTSTMIYDGGNPALWWLAIFGMAFTCWQAFKRRSLPLALVAIAFFWQWLSWARVDRAAFEYHFYTALPFFLVALAYFLAELWHGPSRRTWLLARVGGAVALIFPAAAWFLKSPLCDLARVGGTDNSFKDTICGGTTGEVVIETRMLLVGIVLIIAVAILALTLIRLERRQNAGLEDPNWLVQLLVPVGVAGVAVWWIGQNASHDPIFQAALPSDALALVLLPVLAILAFVAFTARNPRRFVLGACAFAVVVGVAFYPDWSALPLPTAIVSVYQGLLPTWFYGFEFSVNQQESAHVNLISAWSMMLALLALVVAAVAGWAAWERRVVVGYRRAKRLRARSQTAAAAPTADSTPASTDGGDSSGAPPA